MSETYETPAEHEAKTNEHKKRQAAWGAYLLLDSAEYQAGHHALQDPEHVTPLVYDRGDQTLTLIASRHIGPHGEPLGNHDYNPASVYHADLDRIFDNYLATTEPNKRLGIVEGTLRVADNRDDSIRIGTESSHLAFVARANGMMVISGEPDQADLHRQLFSAGVTPLELAALYAMWSLGGMVRRNGSLDELGAHLIVMAHQAEVPGIAVYSENERVAMTNDQRYQALSKLNSAAAVLVPQLNEALGRKWFLVKDGAPVLNLPAEVIAEPAALEQAVGDAWWPDRPGRINQVSRLTSDLRDKHLFNMILDQLQAGKSPIVPFGSTHIARLKPCFDHYLASDAARLDVSQL